MKKFWRILIFMAITIVLIGCTKEDKGRLDDVGHITKPLEKTLEIGFLNVEKADCIVINDGSHTVMIDTGYGRSIEQIEPYLKERNCNTIDYLILTHYDKDHIGSADHILSSYEVKNVILPNYESNTKQYTQLIEALNESKVKPMYITKDTEITIGDSHYMVYPPKKDNYKQADNDFSLGVHLSYGNHKYFFAGDAEKERISELLTIDNIQSDVYKVPHHGRIEKNSEDLIEKVSPDYAVVTASEEEPADDELLELLDKHKCKVYKTQDGSVIIKDDGLKLDISQVA